MDRPARLARWSGVAGPLVGMTTTLAATVASPSFAWTGSALSDLGAPGAATPWLFNGGLVASALLTAPFAWVVWTDARHDLHRLGATTFAAALAALAAVGLFPVGTRLHVPAAVAYFALLTFVAWVHGSGTVLAGDPPRGLLEVWLGIAHVVAWVGWAAIGLGGVAIPELAGSFLLYAWIIIVFRSSTARASARETSATAP